MVTVTMAMRFTTTLVIIIMTMMVTIGNHHYACSQYNDYSYSCDYVCDPYLHVIVTLTILTSRRNNSVTIIVTSAPRPDGHMGGHW